MDIITLCGAIISRHTSGRFRATILSHERPSMMAEGRVGPCRTSALREIHGTSIIMRDGSDAAPSPSLTIHQGDRSCRRSAPTYVSSCDTSPRRNCARCLGVKVFRLVISQCRSNFRPLQDLSSFLAHRFLPSLPFCPPYETDPPPACPSLSIIY